MDPTTFLADVEAKPSLLRGLADRAGDVVLTSVDLGRVTQVVLTGLGSSRFAAMDAARELRASGWATWCDYASADLGPLGPGTLLVAISASGATPETVAAARNRGGSQVIAITNRADSPLVEQADSVSLVHAGAEQSGAVTSSMIHSVLTLRVLRGLLTDRPYDLARDAHKAADAIESLLADREEWLPAAAELLDSPDGLHFIAEAARCASAAQSALVIRETARRSSTACEAADWAHTDVYLTRSQDYRAVLLGSNPHLNSVFEWTQRRGARVLSFGADEPRADLTVRYPGDRDPAVAPLVETLLAELLGHRWFDTGVSIESTE